MCALISCVVSQERVKTVPQCFTALISSIITYFLSYYARFMDAAMSHQARRGGGSCVNTRRHTESGHKATERCELLSDSTGGVVYPPHSVGWKSKASPVESFILYVWLSRCCRWFMVKLYCILSAGFLS